MRGKKSKNIYSYVLFPRELARMVFLLFCSPTLQTFMMCLYVCREVQKLTENEMSSMWVLKRECTEISLSSTLKRYSLLSMWSNNKAICIQLTSFINAKNIFISSDFIYLRSVTFSIDPRTFGIWKYAFSLNKCFK